MKLTRAAAVATAVAVVAGLPALPSTAGTTDRVVSYHGYQVAVPDGWAVVDLERDPSACVRFDRPAIYFGKVGDQAGCPAHLVGRAEGLLIEPLDRATVRPQAVEASRGTAQAPGNAASVDGEIQVAVEDAGVLVTAFHAPGQEQVVRKVLGGARLTSGGEAQELTRPPEQQRAATAAATTIAPGTFLGKAFDTCSAPAQSAVDAWWSSSTSPYKAVGIYISGGVRACAQPNLTAGWVSANAARWRLLPIDVGLQAPCSSYASTKRMSVDPAQARSQGRTAAAGAAQAAAALGIGARSTLYTDIEHYTSNATCKAAVLSYVSGWTIELNTRGYLGGVYTSASSGGADLASAYNDTRYTRPDSLWFAWWNEQADTKSTKYFADNLWGNHQRVHQYLGDHDETHGGVTINIDSNWVDLTAPPPGATGFDATGAYARATLRWTKPSMSNFSQFIVRRSTGAVAPTSPTTGTAVYAGTATTATATGLAASTTYTFRVWVKDTSGKVGPPADTRLVGTRTTASASPTSLTVGGSTRIYGRVVRSDNGAALAGVPMSLHRRQKGTTAWQLITTATTGSTGYVSYVHKPVWSQDYQWGYNGSADLLGSRGPNTAVGVRPVVTANVSKTSFALGGSVLIYGSVNPAHPGQAVYLQRWVNGKWNHVTTGKLTSKSTYMFGIKPTVRGTYAYRVAKPGDVDHLTTTSPMKTFKVT